MTKKLTALDRIKRLENRFREMGHHLDELEIELGEKQSVSLTLEKRYNELLGQCRQLGQSISVLETRLASTADRCYARHLEGVRALDVIEHRDPGIPMVPKIQR